MSAGAPDWNRLQREGKLPANQIDKVPLLKENEDLKQEVSELKNTIKMMEEETKDLYKQIKELKKNPVCPVEKKEGEKV